jgi:hypothetical protein
LKDGIYGEVYMSINMDTGDLFLAEEIEKTLYHPGLILDQLRDVKVKTCTPSASSYYLGFKDRSESVSLFRPLMDDGATVKHLLKVHDRLDVTIVRHFICQTVAGLKQLQRDGYEAAYVTTNTLPISQDGTLRVESSILDSTIMPNLALNMSLVTLPEIHASFKYEDRSKSNVWLVGMVTIEMLLGVDWTANPVQEMVSQIMSLRDETQTESLPLILGSISQTALDFVRKCLVK